jgi:hypothetical protein
MFTRIVVSVLLIGIWAASALALFNWKGLSPPVHTASIPKPETARLITPVSAPAEDEIAKMLRPATAPVPAKAAPTPASAHTAKPTAARPAQPRKADASGVILDVPKTPPKR